MAKATMKLIQELRSQLPPEAAEKLDDLESLAADEKPEDGDESAPGDDMGMPPDDEGSDEPADVNAMAYDDGAEGSPEEEAAESPDEEDDEQAAMKAKGKLKKPAKKGLSFFG